MGEIVANQEKHQPAEVHIQEPWARDPRERVTTEELERFLGLTLTETCECCDAPIPTVRRLALEVRELREELARAMGTRGT